MTSAVAPIADMHRNLRMKLFALNNVPNNAANNDHGKKSAQNYRAQH